MHWSQTWLIEQRQPFKFIYLTRNSKCEKNVVREKKLCLVILKSFCWKNIVSKWRVNNLFFETDTIRTFPTIPSLCELYFYLLKRKFLFSRCWRSSCAKSFQNLRYTLVTFNKIELMLIWLPFRISRSRSSFILPQLVSVFICWIFASQYVPPYLGCISIWRIKGKLRESGEP